ncbi:MAG: DNA polymerase III subunit delta [Acidobacteria bacterium]|nr:DNA polymerase III subunit delta [Acidobacteriota bacterium]
MAMTPEQFLTQVKLGRLLPVYLFVGPDGYKRDKCRRALIEYWLAEGEEREQGLTRLDLDDTTLADAMDDAMSYSLFASKRVIWITSAEVALPRGKDTEGAAEPVARFLKNPPPGVMVILQCSRFEFDNEDKAKLERVQKFYSCVVAQVEFPHPTPLEARALAQLLARDSGLRLAPDAMELLIEATGANATRISIELEKLGLLTGEGGAVTLEQVQKMVPDARESTIFVLVAAMGRRDRKTALEVLDTLVREGEYLPLALSFLAGQFRMAMTAKEARLAGAAQIQQYFSRQGVPMWKARAEQVAQTAQAFTLAQMQAAVQGLFKADRGLRDIRPDDRTVMEQFILALTAAG